MARCLLAMENHNSITTKPETLAIYQSPDSGTANSFAVVSS